MLHALARQARLAAALAFTFCTLATAAAADRMRNQGTGRLR